MALYFLPALQLSQLLQIRIGYLPTPFLRRAKKRVFTTMGIFLYNRSVITAHFFTGQIVHSFLLEKSTPFSVKADGFSFFLMGANFVVPIELTDNS